MLDFIIGFFVIPGCLILAFGMVGVAVEMLSDVWQRFFPNYDDAYDPERFK